MHFWGFWKTVAHLALSIATVPSTLYGSQTYKIYIIHDKFFIHNTHWLFRVANKNFVQHWTWEMFIYLIRAVDEHPLKSSGRASQKLTHPLLEQLSMQCEFSRDSQGSSSQVAFWQATMADASWKEGTFRWQLTWKPIYIIRGWRLQIRQ